MGKTTCRNSDSTFFFVHTNLTWFSSMVASKNNRLMRYILLNNVGFVMPELLLQQLYDWIRLMTAEQKKANVRLVAWSVLGTYQRQNYY